MQNADLWQKCVDFHGHSCGGLAIGFRAALYARKLLDIDFSEDEQIVCITENDACGVDAISVILGCSVGKGNLLFRIRGKQAFSFYNRLNGRSFRLLLKEQPDSKKDKADKLEYMLNAPDEQLFAVTEVIQPLPPEAQIYGSKPCDECGEMTAECFLRDKNGKMLCADCYDKA